VLERTGLNAQLLLTYLTDKQQVLLIYF